mmetsp:Transcript_20820/g.45260  ORF Transcript_20820/g.45260 Transcript_20820/m.45260 type:complete len:288 (+) Transcript_20820:398-1261(+)
MCVCEKERERARLLERRLSAWPVDGKCRNRVVATVRDQDKGARRIDGDAAARVEDGGRRRGKRRDDLQQLQRGLLAAAVDEVCGDGGVEAEDGDRRGELVHHVCGLFRLVKLDVSRSVGRRVGRGAGERARGCQAARAQVEHVLPDEVHAQIGDERDSAEFRIQDNRVRVRLRLPVLQVVLSRGGAHGDGRLQQRHDGRERAVHVDSHCSERPVPIVGEEEAVELRREGQVARRGAVRRLRAAPREGAGAQVDGERLDVAGRVDRLGRRVHDGARWVEAHEGRVVDA